MGIFATELATILTTHAPSDTDPWAPLFQIGMHPDLISRLQQATEEPSIISLLMRSTCNQLAKFLNLDTRERARLEAGIEADVFARLMIYHNYPPEEIANKANAVFANALKDCIATGGNSAARYVAQEGVTSYVPVKPQKRRGRPRRDKNVTPPPEAIDAE